MSRAVDALKWCADTFGPVALDRRERALRFVEEAIELAQAEGVEIAAVGAVTGRVYSRPAGDTSKEIGQAQMCLEVLAANYGVSADVEACREFDRVRKVPKEEWARRHSAKVALGIASASSRQEEPT